MFVGLGVMWAASAAGASETEPVDEGLAALRTQAGLPQSASSPVEPVVEQLTTTPDRTLSAADSLLAPVVAPVAEQVAGPVLSPVVDPVVARVVDPLVEHVVEPVVTPIVEHVTQVAAPLVDVDRATSPWNPIPGTSRLAPARPEPVLPEPVLPESVQSVSGVEPHAVAERSGVHDVEATSDHVVGSTQKDDAPGVPPAPPRRPGSVPAPVTPPSGADRGSPLGVVPAAHRSRHDHGERVPTADTPWSSQPRPRPPVAPD